jgi:hypothetical protein
VLDRHRGEGSLDLFFQLMAQIGSSRNAFAQVRYGGADWPQLRVKCREQRSVQQEKAASITSNITSLTPHQVLINGTVEPSTGTM